MKLDNTLFDEIQKQAESSPRLRMHYDLRTQADLSRGVGVAPASDEPWRDSSQRMINVLMPETVIPIHRHNDTSETVIVCRGKVREEFYDAEGNKTGQYHTLVCLEDGSVIFEAKDRAYGLVGWRRFSEG